MDRARSAGLRMRRTKRATPGGYGGKPPGVAFIGAPTGARNAGSGAPAGDQSTGKHVTPNRPHVRQDRIRSESADEDQLVRTRDVDFAPDIAAYLLPYAETRRCCPIRRERPLA